MFSFSRNVCRLFLATNKCIPESVFEVTHCNQIFRSFSSNNAVIFNEIPKQKLNIYAYFVKINSNSQNAKGFFQKCPTLYSKLSMVQKEKLKQSHDKYSLEHENAWKKYWLSLTPEQLLQIQTHYYEKESKKYERSLKKLKKDLKKPASVSGGGAFNTFWKGKKIQLKEARAMWDKLSEAEKTKFSSIAEKENKQINAQLLKWEEEMLALNHLELIREKYLPADKRKEVKQMKIDRNNKMMEKVVNKIQKAFGKPVAFKKESAYSLFCKEKYPLKNTSDEDCKKAWDNFNNKATYVKQADKINAEEEKKLSKWNEMMISRGHKTFIQI